MRKFRILSDLFFCFRKKAIFYTNSHKILRWSKFLKFLTPVPKGYNSQEGQDKIAEKILIDFGIDTNSLNIVDVGANHPVILNNTYYFEVEKSAKVFSIEPNPEFIKEYEKYRRTIISLAIGSEEEELLLHIPQRKLKEEYHDNVHASFIADELDDSAYSKSKSIKVDVKRLASVIPLGHYNILFIDVEGFELQVLNGIDFEKFSFDLIFIENNSRLRPLNNIRRYLKTRGYLFNARIHGLDDVYVKASKN